MKSVRNLAVIVIPARLKSLRVPKKLLREIDGKSVLQRTYEQATKARSAYAVAIAVCESEELYDHAITFAKHVWHTPDYIRCGTTRVGILARHAAFSKADIVVNVQGDEPSIDPDLIDRVIQAMSDDIHLDMVTAVIRRPDSYLPTPNSTVYAVMKHNRLYDLVRYQEGDTIPSPLLEHIGIAAFRKSSLAKFMKLAPSDRDRAQGNEYLTAIDNAFRIKVIEVDAGEGGINVEADLVEDKNPTPRKKYRRMRKKSK